MGMTWAYSGKTLFLSLFSSPRAESARAVTGRRNSYRWDVALFDMPNLNRFDILSISIFCKIALSISISISIFSKITISISISISIFLELPYRYRYRYRYFSELPYRYRYRYRYFQLLHIDIDIFQKCRYIDNRYVISIYRTGLNERNRGRICPILKKIRMIMMSFPCYDIDHQ